MSVFVVTASQLKRLEKVNSRNVVIVKYTTRIDVIEHNIGMLILVSYVQFLLYGPPVIHL
jgi:hypothetical protein